MNKDEDVDDEIELNETREWSSWGYSGNDEWD